ncbi:NUDIX hydrolase [Candidatus Sumerlaeota bacterium]|nr:NUDIX hydrolase [Candidatus Sumerlaeales bacterium]NLD62156.1 NUDIX hydrolase [Candidatus Sumerlaeota bacterium]
MQNNKPSLLKEPWLKWATELQFIAQAGLTYSKDPFDLERFERIRTIAAEMMAHKTGISLEKIRDLFCNETGFQTPKIDTRAAIFKKDKVLLVHEIDGRWSMPGGWVDVNDSVGNSTAKEAKEEAGLDVMPTRIIAIHDRNKHNPPIYPYGVCKIFVLCKVVGGHFEPNIETTEIKYFDTDNLPPLAENKNTVEQIKLCLKASKSRNWKIQFD